MSKKDKEIFMWDENLAITKLPSTPKLCKEDISYEEKTYKDEPKKEFKEESKEKAEPKVESNEYKKIQKEIDNDPFFFS